MEKKQDKVQLYRDELAIISSGECFTDQVRVVSGYKTIREILRQESPDGFTDSLYDRHARRLLNEILADFLV